MKNILALLFAAALLLPAPVQAMVAIVETPPPASDDAPAPGSVPPPDNAPAPRANHRGPTKFVIKAAPGQTGTQGRTQGSPKQNQGSQPGAADQ